MAGQILEKTVDEAATFKLAPLDILFVVDENGDRTGELRIGDGRTAGGYAIDGVAGGVAGVTTWNGNSGNVTAGIADLTDVSTSGAATDDVLKYTGSGFAPGTLDVSEISGIQTAAATAGQALLFNDSTGDFEPGDIPAAAGDNLGNHLATQLLDLNGNDLADVNELRFNGDSQRWLINANAGAGRLAFSRKNDGVNPSFSVLMLEGYAESNNTPNVDGLYVFANDSSRQSDAVANAGLGIPGTAVTNLCYFSDAGQLLKANTGDVSFGAFGDIDIDTAAPTNGQVLAFNSTSGNFEPADSATDDLGNHTATQDLDMAANNITAAGSLALSGDPTGEWKLQGLGGGRAAISRTRNSDGVTEFGLVVNAGFGALLNQPNVDGVTLTAYNSSRLSDATGNQGGATSTPVTNLAYFGSTGQLLKAPTDEVSIGVFEDVDLTSLASGDMLYYNGTSFVRVAAGTNGQTLTMVGGVPAWA